MTTLTTSDAPMMASAIIDRMRLVDSAKPMVATPNSTVTPNRIGPIGGLSG